MTGQPIIPGRGLTPWFRQGPLAVLRDEMEGVFERFWEENGNGLGLRMAVPPLDLSETADFVQVRLDLPGLDAKDIEVHVRDNQLTVKGERKEEKEEKGETFHRVERREGKFSRSVLLPCGVSEDKVDAQFRNGVLTIKLPKTEQAKPKRIEVKGA